MFKELIKKFIHQEGSHHQTQANARSLPVEIAYSKETTRLLQRIKNSRSLVTVQVDGSESTYLSAVLEVNEVSGYFVLDGLSSGSGHRALTLIKQAEISTRIGGQEIKFDCRITAVGEQDGVAYYKVPFPAELKHELRRKHLRVETPRGKLFQVHMHTEADDLVIGELSDLSIGGFGIHLKRETSNKVARGDLIPKCVLYMEDQEPLQLQLEIRYCEDKRFHSNPRLGGKFLNLNHNTERRLQKYISQLDRAQAKNHNAPLH